MTSDRSARRNLDISVFSLALEDVRRFSSWEHHTDVRFYAYDFPDLAFGKGGYALASRRWFYKRQIPFLRWLYGIEDSSGNLVGYLKAVKKNFFQSQAEISIVLNPALLNKGYGSEATRQFLRICFKELNLESVWLRVAAFNDRGRRVYEKAGFEYVENRQQVFEDQRFNDELLRGFPQQFFLKNGKLMTTYYYMRLSRDAFEKQDL